MKNYLLIVLICMFVFFTHFNESVALHVSFSDQKR